MLRPAQRAVADRTRTIRYLIAVVLLPVLVVWRQDNSIFTGYGYLDPWFYLGFFRNLVEFKRNFFPGTYYGSRLSWILPGAAIHGLLPPVAAAYVLHLAVHTTATVSLFLILKWLTSERRAFLATLLFAVNPWVWSATGWDYVDGVAIAYFLLTFALLTWSALRPGQRWGLFASGLAMAGMVYANLYWVTLAWPLPLVYVAMVCMWHGERIRTALLRVCLWFGAGCLAVTVALGVVNIYLDGHFFFYAPSVLEALQIRGRPVGLFGPVWSNGAPSAWMVFAVVAMVASVVMIIRCARGWARRENLPALLLAALFLYASGWMLLTQLRGNPVLGLYYYASDLLPFSFLVIGAWFWPGLDGLKRSVWLAICLWAAAIAIFTWSGRPATRLAEIPYSIPIGILVFLAALLVRRRVAGIVMALAACGLLAAVGCRMRYSDADPHAFRKQYEAVLAMRERIEAARRTAAVRLWFDEKDASAPDATALVSSYIWSFSTLGSSYDKPPGVDAPCDVELVPSTVIAAVSASPGVDAAFLESALEPCWKGRQLRAVPISSETFDRGSYRDFLTLLRVETVPGTWTPQAAFFDGAGRGELKDAAGSSWPLDRWKLQPGDDSKAYLRPTGTSVKVQTHAVPGSVAAVYPAIHAAVAGRYRFRMAYWRDAGFIQFAAVAPGETGKQLASATNAYWNGTDPELVFWMDLAAGQEFQLAIVNYNQTVRLPASFLMKSVSAVRVAATSK